MGRIPLASSFSLKCTYKVRFMRRTVITPFNFTTKRPVPATVPLRHLYDLWDMQITSEIWSAKRTRINTVVHLEIIMTQPLAR